MTLWLDNTDNTCHHSLASSVRHWDLKYWDQNQLYSPSILNSKDSEVVILGQVFSLSSYCSDMYDSPVLNVLLHWSKSPCFPHWVKLFVHPDRLRMWLKFDKLKVLKIAWRRQGWHAPHFLLLCFRQPTTFMQLCAHTLSVWMSMTHNMSKSR